MRYEHGEISFDAPPGYEGRALVALTAARAAATVAITQDRLPKGETLRGYFDRNLVEMARRRSGLLLSKSAARQLAGLPAWELSCTWKTEAGALEQRLVMTAIGEHVVTIAVTDDQGHGAELDARLAGVLASLRVRGAPLSAGAAARPVTAHDGAAPASFHPSSSSSSSPPPMYAMAAASGAPASSPPPPKRGRWTRPIEAVPAQTVAPSSQPGSSVMLVGSRASGFVPAGPSAAESAAASLAAAHWQCDPSLIGAARDLSMRLPWAVRHQVVSVTGPDAKWLIVATGAGAPLLFDGECRLAALNRMVRAEHLRLPRDLETTRLADALLLLLLGPTAGIVGCPSFLDSQRPHFARWLAPPYDEAERIFVQHCAAPRLTVTERDAQWSLDFAMFNARGGIDVCRASGDTYVRAFDRKLVVQHGRLHFPYAA